MRSEGFDGMVCSVADVLAALGDRWGMLIERWQYQVRPDDVRLEAGAGADDLMRWRLEKRRG